MLTAGGGDAAVCSPKAQGQRNRDLHIHRPCQDKQQSVPCFSIFFAAETEQPPSQPAAPVFQSQGSTSPQQEAALLSKADWRG